MTDRVTDSRLVGELPLGRSVGESPMRRSVREWLMSHSVRIARELGWIIAGQFVTTLGALVLVRVLTELLTPAEFGRLALSLTVAGLVNQLLLGGLNNGIVRYYPVAVEAGQMAGYRAAALRLTAWATVVVLVTAALSAAVLPACGASGAVVPVLAASLYAVVGGANSTLGGIQNAARHRAVAAVHAAAESWLRVGLAFMMVLALGPHSHAALGAYGLAALLVLVSQALYVHRLTTPTAVPAAAHAANSESRWRKDILRFSWPFCAWGPFTWAQQSSDRWALEVFGSTTDVGLYIATFQLGYSPIGLLSGLVMTFLQPILNQRSGAGNDVARNLDTHRITWRVTWVSLAVTLAGVVVATLAHEWIFMLLVAAPYRQASVLLPWVVLAGGLFAAGQLLSTKLSAELRPADMMLMKIVTSMAGVAFNVAGAWWFGAAGVVGGLVAYSLVFFAWMALLARRVRGLA